MLVVHAHALYKTTKLILLDSLLREIFTCAKGKKWPRVWPEASHRRREEEEIELGEGVPLLWVWHGGPVARKTIPEL
jgi:hypothetical protein